jgi:3-oxoadipate enol-lactonase
MDVSATVSANGISINYRFDGPEDGPVVMFSNSLISNYSMWDDQVEAITGAGYRMLRYDTRGHGGTDAPDIPYSIDMFAADVIGLLDALGIEQVHFVGLSMGGFIAQLLAANYSKRVSSLALCDTACVMPPKSLWNDRIAEAQTGGTEALADATLGRWFTAPYHESHPDEVSRVREMINASNVTGYVRCASAIRDMSQCDVLGKIKAPTMVVVGESDPACPVASAEVLHKGIEGSELAIIPQAAHLPNIEKRDEFNSILLDFLERQRN